MFVGAYVKEPKPGAYKWVASLDADSLYPMILSQYNISPETKVNRKYLTEMLKTIES
jgi:DNA polymerase elongation subunit (family B)